MVALAACLLSLRPACGEASSGAERLADVRSFAFAIGDGALEGDVTRRLAPFDQVIVDGAEARTAQVRALRAQGKVVLAYLSVGTIERYRSWYRAGRRYRLDLWGTGGSGTPTPPGPAFAA